MPSIPERPISRAQSASAGARLTYDLTTLKEIEHGDQKGLPELAFRASYWARVVQRNAVMQFHSDPGKASDELKLVHRQLVVELLSTGDDLLQDLSALPEEDVSEFTKWTGLNESKIRTGIQNLEDDLADWHVPVSDFTSNAILEAAGLGPL